MNNKAEKNMTCDLWEPDRCVDKSLPLVVFDRDDTLIQDQGRENCHLNIRWFPNSVKIIALLCSRGYNLAIATNQPGVHEGLHTLEQLWLFNSTLNSQFMEYTNRPISCIASCIHSKSSRCKCRKPEIGLLEKIEAYYGKRPQLFVGDKFSDVQAARIYGIPGLMVNQKNIFDIVSRWLEKNDRY